MEILPLFCAATNPESYTYGYTEPDNWGQLSYICNCEQNSMGYHL